MDSPLGTLRITSDGAAITRLDWVKAAKITQTKDILLQLAAQQLTQYFAGTRTQFTLPLHAEGTKFSRRVWSALSHIPYGETRSYAQLAQALSTAPRAIGGGCGRNPIPIIIPCHRVIAASGKLGGYSGAGGIKTKQKLLDLEQGK